jgi:PBP1b-binding outer membrane lipoprotein LpoB
MKRWLFAFLTAMLISGCAGTEEQNPPPEDEIIEENGNLDNNDDQAELIKETQEDSRQADENLGDQFIDPDNDGVDEDVETKMNK